MRYKDVFLIWLLADMLLATGLVILSFFTLKFAEGDAGMVLLMIIFGLIISLPSLVAMLIFHAVYKATIKNNYHHLPYLLLIFIINFLYWLFGNHGFKSIDINYGYFILLTTLAGSMAFVIVGWRIRKRLSGVDKN